MRRHLSFANREGEIRESRLGKVERAERADTAGRADTAADADELGGLDADAFQRAGQIVSGYADYDAGVRGR